MEFSLARLNHLLKKLLQERSRLILILFATFFLLSFASMSNDYIMIFSALVILGITAGAVCHYSFASYHKTNSQIHTILLPTSTLEKFIAFFVVNVLGIVLILFTACPLGLGVGYLVFQPTSSLLFDFFADFYSTGTLSKRMLFNYGEMILAFASTIVILFYASLFFKEKALGLTFLCFFIYSYLYNYCYQLIVGKVFGWELGINYDAYQFQANIVLNSITIIGFLLLTYLRMKEEEVS